MYDLLVRRFGWKAALFFMACFAAGWQVGQWLL